MKIYKPKSINEAIDSLHTFFEMDMYSKFRPEQKIGKEKLYRQDWFKNEKDFQEYLDTHFKILKKDIRRLK
jgi:hypothetical protein